MTVLKRSGSQRCLTAAHTAPVLQPFKVLEHKRVPVLSVNSPEIKHISGSLISAAFTTEFLLSKSEKKNQRSEEMIFNSWLFKP